MMLFEDDNGEPIFLAGDDSGTNFNSKIEYSLISGRTYYHRLRLYYATRAGQGKVL